MKLARFEYNGQILIGMVNDDHIIPSSLDPQLPTEMPALLAHGEPAFARLRDLAAQHTGIPLQAVRLLAPIAKPDKFIGVGLNYADHIAETGLETPEFPTLFNKQNSCVIGPDAAIHRPRISGIKKKKYFQQMKRRN